MAGLLLVVALRPCCCLTRCELGEHVQKHLRMDGLVDHGCRCFLGSCYCREGAMAPTAQGRVNAALLGEHAQKHLRMGGLVDHGCRCFLGGCKLSGWCNRGQGSGWGEGCIAGGVSSGPADDAGNLDEPIAGSVPGISGG